MNKYSLMIRNKDLERLKKYLLKLIIIALKSSNKIIQIKKMFNLFQRIKTIPRQIKSVKTILEILNRMNRSKLIIMMTGEILKIFKIFRQHRNNLKVNNKMTLVILKIKLIFRKIYKVIRKIRRILPINKNKNKFVLNRKVNLKNK